MEKGGTIRFIIFGIFVLIIIFGGYFLMKESEVKKEDNNALNNTSKKEEDVDIRLDKTKEYIYYTNYERVIDELDIEYKDIVFNFKGANTLADELNKETEELKKTLTYDEEQEDIAYNKLVSAKYKQYEFLVYGDYISLIVRYYNFTKDNLVSFEKAKTYVFSKKDGKEISEEDLLSKFNITKDAALNKIKTYIDDQDLLKEGESLDSAASISNITSLNLYVDKMGKLESTILVKSDQKDYNDSIKLN